ncbi:MAG: iron chelate uptake ABC transporter family permease subunit [Syntrophomonadaceae bacterium]|mgnify:CR=1 FL=1|jgi:iron complex transport system permease protein|nr:iron chelate uptake ABC transporter family permease subunit [Syntrophomonadaceae bacterium]
MQHRKKHVPIIIGLLALLLVILLLIGIGIGAVWIPPGEVLSLIKSGLNASSSGYSGQMLSHYIIIWSIRFPRVLLGAMVGICLSVAGAIFQGLFRNPMADPYVIGVSSGAALGAVAAILLLGNLGIRYSYSIPAFAFVCAILTILLVYNLARTGGKVPVMTLLLAGIAVNSFLSALQSLAMFYSGDQLHQVVFWLMGGFSSRGWEYIGMFMPYAVIGTAIAFLYTRELNGMLIGEEQAQHLGIDVERVKIILLVAAALLIGASVSVSGLIGFVGLIIPHVVRLIIGPDHRVLLPMVALTGAIFMVGADIIARTVIAPEELPVGVVTALIGGPFFIYLLRKQKTTLYK